ATTPVEQGSITSAVQATGTINPVTTVPVGSFVSGTVKYIFADFNTHVESGQVLALIDPQVYDAQVVQARGGLEHAVANQRNLEANVTAQCGHYPTDARTRRSRRTRSRRRRIARHTR